MNVTWGDMQTGRFEVLVDGRFFEAGAVVEADTAAGFVRYIPADAATGALLWDAEKRDWMVLRREGAVRIFEWPKYLRPC